MLFESAKAFLFISWKLQVALENMQRMAQTKKTTQERAAGREREGRRSSS